MEEEIILGISTHSGDLDIVSVTEYNSEDLAKKLNDMEIHAVAIGKHVYSRIDIKNIRPVEKEISE